MRTTPQSVPSVTVCLSSLVWILLTALDSGVLIAAEVAKGRTVVASGSHGQAKAAKAVDGIISDDSRWIGSGLATLARRRARW